MTYTPRPIDTEDVVLEHGLESLVERLAEHVHELWAQARLAEGWTYAHHRDDEAKTHPGLVPYRDLTDSEKAYDRRTARGTLRALIAFGYEIRPRAIER